MQIILVGVLLGMFFSFNAIAGEANLYNPYMHKRLPSQSLSDENADMVKSLGGKKSTIQDEAQYRKYWRQEVYPIVFGNATSNNEILVFIDYANPRSEEVWKQVLLVSQSINPHSNKIVVFAKNSEAYGTELMGGGIWVAYARPAYALDYFRYTLGRWNEVKRALLAKGIKRPFVYEYDATSTKQDYPIIYSYLNAIQPPMAQNEISGIEQYSFDAGNVNMYQAVVISNEYDVEEFPAIVVNGELLDSISAQDIIAALR